ncbi:MAG: hypothetical protein LBP91_00830, partial [Coriobacteriales bacterium]|nr:hypothetical protein [Coriobacteriales bacterium]
MLVIAALIIVPIVTALGLLVLRNDTVRTVLVIASTVLLVALALVLTAWYLASPQGFVVPHAEIINYFTLGVGLACG